MLLIGLQARAEPLTESGFKAVQGRLGKRAAMIADGDFSIRTSQEPRLFDGAIALAPVAAGMKHGTFAGRRDQLCAVSSGRGIAHPAVVSAVTDDDRAGLRPSDVQHVAEHLAVAFPAGRDDGSNHERSRRINAKTRQDGFCGRSGAGGQGRWSARCRGGGSAVRWNRPRCNRQTWATAATRCPTAGGRA